MTHSDMKLFESFDYLGLYREMNQERTEKAQAKANWLSRQLNKLIMRINAETSRVERFVESRDMPDPMQAKLYAMQDAATEYGRRKNDEAVEEAA